MEPHQREVNNGSGNGLVPSDPLWVHTLTFIHLSWLASIILCVVINPAIEPGHTLFPSLSCTNLAVNTTGEKNLHPWWRHQMETFSALLAICAGNSPVPGEFPTQRPVTWSFDVYFDLHPNKRLSKHSWGWWFETASCPLWHHHNAEWWDTWYCWIITNHNKLKLSRIRTFSFIPNSNFLIYTHWNLPKEEYDVLIWIWRLWLKKNGYRKSRNAQVTWLAIMHIFNKVGCWYSIPSKIIIQVTHTPNITEIKWKQFKFLPGHQIWIYTKIGIG